MRDREDPTAFEVLILALMLEDDPSAEEVKPEELDASTTPGETHRARPERGH
jgi:hypothetical protein